MLLLARAGTCLVSSGVTEVLRMCYGSCYGMVYLTLMFALRWCYGVRYGLCYGILYWTFSCVLRMCYGVRYGLCYGVMFIEPLIRVTVLLRYCYGLWILCKNHILLGFCYGIVTEMDVLVTERYGVYTVTLRNVHVTQSLIW